MDPWLATSAEPRSTSLRIAEETFESILIDLTQTMVTVFLGAA